MGLGVAAVMGALLGTPGCGDSTDQAPTGSPPPDLPKTPAEYESSAPREKV
jgi:hypothetical protein